jgi:voltage-gated potassium channel
MMNDDISLRTGGIGTPMRVWVPLLQLIATIEAVAVPLRIVLGSESAAAFPMIDGVITAVFIIDALINLRNAGNEKTRSGRIVLAADVVAAIPFHLLTGFFPLVFLRLVKLLRVARWMGIWRDEHPNRWNVLRLVYFVYWLALSVHWLAVGWLALRGIPPGENGWTLYLHALYWCISTLTTIGYVDFKPASDAEFIYAMIVMIFGVGMYGYVIANVSTIITNLQPARVRYQENMEKLGAFMRYKSIPRNLQQKIRDYYAHVWDQRLGVDESAILTGLPPGLFTEVSLFLKRDIIQKVPFFRSANENLIRDIALQMHPVIFTPGDMVFRVDEDGNAMYFISRGRLEVIDRDGVTIVATLGEGEFFGEMALLLHQARTATVRAVGYCDLYRLDREAFDAIMRGHPSFAEVIRAMSTERKANFPRQTP